MADDKNRAQELKEARELEAIDRRRRDIAKEMQGITASQAYTRDSVSQAAALTDYARMLTEQMKEQAGITRGRSEVDKSLLSISQQLQQSAQKITSELGNEYRVQQQIAKDRELQRKIEVEIGTIRNNLSKEQIAALTQVNSLNQNLRDSLRDQASKQEELNMLTAQQDAHNKGLVELTTEQLAEMNKRGDKLSEEIISLDEKIKKETDLLDLAKASLPSEAMKLSTLEDQLGVINDIQGIRQAELKTQREITRATGVTGAVVGGIGGIMQRLGMRSGVFNQAMDDAKESMEAMAGEAIKGGKAISKMAIAMKGFSIIAKTAFEVLKDPAVIVGGIIDGFFKLNQAGVEFGQMTGQAADAMHGVNTEVSTAIDMMKTASSLTREIGLNAAAIFTPQQVGQISDAVTLLGLGEQAAGRLGVLMNITGKSADQINEGVYKTVSALNAAGKSAVAPRQVLDDVLNASEDITISLGNNPKKLAEAATAARKFGMTLSQVDKIADSLLDFESSIEAELEAQLLTGKNINMSKARELALNNDLAGLAKELERQGVSAAEFSKMNRIQQEATAKALGMSRQELSKSLLTQEAQKNMTEEQIAAARGVSLEESKRISIQERIQKAVEKLQLAFAPILEALVPIVEMSVALLEPIMVAAGFVGKLVAGFIKLTPVMTTLKGLVLAAFGKKLISSIFLQGKSMKQLVAIQKAYNLAKSHEFNLNKAGKLDGRLAQAKAMKNLTIGQTIALKAHNAAVAVGNGIRKAAVATYNFLTTAKMRSRLATLGETIATKSKLVYDRIAVFLGKSRIAQYIAERAAIVAKTAATWLGIGAQKAANVAAMQAGTAGAAAGGGMAAAGAGLGAFGVAAAPAIPIILAIGGALLMASPAIYALGQMVVGLAKVIGGVLMKALEMLPSIIDAVAQGFVTMLGAVTLEKVAALFLMGPALMSVAAGLGVLTASIFTSLPAIGMLGAIALMGPGLAMAGDGISKMAEGVAKLSAAIQSLETEKLKEVKDLVLTTAFAAPAVAATGAITSLIQGITGGGGDNTDAKLDELIAAVREGHIVDIYLDGERIGRQQALTASTLS